MLLVVVIARRDGSKVAAAPVIVADDDADILSRFATPPESHHIHGWLLVVYILCVTPPRVHATPSRRYVPLPPPAGFLTMNHPSTPRPQNPPLSLASGFLGLQHILTSAPGAGQDQEALQQRLSEGVVKALESLREPGGGGGGGGGATGMFLLFSLR